jgi:hypothetical protein
MELRRGKRTRCNAGCVVAGVGTETFRQELLAQMEEKMGQEHYGRNGLRPRWRRRSGLWRRR